VSVWASAQSVSSINYSVSAGFPSNQVYAIFQDRAGFLWFGTDNGVARYDGFEFQRFGVENGLSDPVVFGFYEDYKGRIWFRTFSGRLSYLENGQIITYRYNHLLLPIAAQSIVTAISVDSADQVTISTARYNGSLVTVSREGEVKVKRFDNAVFYEQRGDDALFGYDINPRSKFLFNGKEYAHEIFKKRTNEYITSLLWRDKILIAYGSVVLEFDGTEVREVYRSPASIVSLCKDKQDNIWVGSERNGVVRFPQGDFKSPIPEEFLKSYSVTSIVEDREKGFWFSTIEKGVFYVPNRFIKNFVFPESEAVAIIRSNKEKIRLATREGSLYDVFESGDISKRFSIAPAAVGLYVDSSGNTYLSNSTETFVLKNGTSPPGHYRFACMSFTEDDKGNVYTGGGGSVAVQFNRTGIIRPKALTMVIRKLFWCDDSTVYITSKGGFFKSDPSFTKVTELSLLSDFKITEMLKLSPQDLLFATQGRGLVHYNRLSGRIINYNNSSSFVANNIYGMVRDRNHIWVATENGLARIDIASLLAGKMQMERLSQSNGLVSNHIQHLAITENGIWAFHENSYSIIDKKINLFANNEPQFYLKEFRSNNRPLANLEKGITLFYDQNTLQIDFGFISFNNQKLNIRYRLSSSDPWSYTTNRYLEFYALAPGSYTLELEYSTDNVNWKSGYRSGLISITPPVWKSWYFLAMMVLAAGVLIYLYFINRLSIFKRHQQRLIQAELLAIEKERARIAKDLHDTVGTDFTAIKMQVNQLLHKHNEPKAEELEEQFKHTLQEIKNIIYGLTPPGLERYGLLAALSTYVEKMKGNMPVQIHMDTFGNEIQDPELSITIFRIIQELISNTLKHAQATRIRIHINSFDDSLNIVYEDNGKGFTWEYIKRGLGLYNIESRVQLLRGTLKFESGDFGVSYTIDIPMQNVSDLEPTSI